MKYNFISFEKNANLCLMLTSVTARFMDELSGILKEDCLSIVKLMWLHQAVFKFDFVT